MDPSCCIYIYLCICIHVCMHFILYISISIYIYICVYMCLYMHIFVYVYMCIYLYINTQKSEAIAHPIGVGFISRLHPVIEAATV